MTNLNFLSPLFDDERYYYYYYLTFNVSHNLLTNIDFVKKKLAYFNVLDASYNKIKSMFSQAKYPSQASRDEGASTYSYEYTYKLVLDSNEITSLSDYDVEYLTPVTCL